MLLFKKQKALVEREMGFWINSARNVSTGFKRDLDLKGLAKFLPCEGTGGYVSLGVDPKGRGTGTLAGKEVR